MIHFVALGKRAARDQTSGLCVQAPGSPQLAVQNQWHSEDGDQNLQVIQAMASSCMSKPGMQLLVVRQIS